MAELTDHELLTRFALTADEAAFAALVTRHVNLVWSAARRFTGEDTLAGEVTQAVFILLAQKAGGLSTRTVLTGWLYHRLVAGAARSECRALRRSAGCQPALPCTQPACAFIAMRYYVNHDSATG